MRRHWLFLLFCHEIISDQLHPVPLSPWVRAASWPKEQRRSWLIFAVISLLGAHPATVSAPGFIQSRVYSTLMRKS
jgi:hypothetical protein